MITLTHRVGEVDIRFIPPPTTRDILDWTVWIAARDGLEPVEVTATNAIQWATQWTPDYDVAELDALLAEQADNAFVALVELCNAIAASPGLPQHALDDLAKLLDRKNEVPERWRTPGVCRCARCTAAANGIDMDNPQGEVCAFDDIDPRALIISRAADAADLEAPLYVNQVRGIIAATESRKWQYDKHQREEREKWQKAMADRGFIRTRTTH